MEDGGNRAQYPQQGDEKKKYGRTNNGIIGLEVRGKYNNIPQQKKKG